MLEFLASLLDGFEVVVWLLAKAKGFGVVLVVLLILLLVAVGAVVAKVARAVGRRLNRKLDN